MSIASKIRRRKHAQAPKYDVAVGDGGDFITADGTGVSLLSYLSTADMVFRVYREMRPGNREVIAVRWGTETGSAYAEFDGDDADVLYEVAHALHNAAGEISGYCDKCDDDESDDSDPEAVAA